MFEGGDLGEFEDALGDEFEIESVLHARSKWDAGPMATGVPGGNTSAMTNRKCIYFKHLHYRFELTVRVSEARETRRLES